MPDIFRGQTIKKFSFTNVCRGSNARTKTHYKLTIKDS